MSYTISSISSKRLVTALLSSCRNERGPGFKIFCSVLFINVLLCAKLRNFDSIIGMILDFRNCRIEYLAKF